MTRPITIESTIHFERRGRGRRKTVCSGEAPAPTPHVGRVPRIARFMALAIRFDRRLHKTNSPPVPAAGKTPPPQDRAGPASRLAPGQ